MADDDGNVTPFPRKKRSGVIRAYDEGTGEVLPGRYVDITRKKPGGLSSMYGPHWAAVNLAAMAELRDAPLRGFDWKVFHHLMGKLEIGNDIRSRAVDVARELGANRSQVAASIRNLRDAKILVPREDFGWRLHPRFGFRGDPTGLVAKRRNGELVLLPR